MTLTLDFEGQLLKKLYHSNKRVNWHETKRMWVDRMLDSSFDLKLLPHPWHWPWIFKVKFLIMEWEVDRLGIKEMRVRYNVGFIMGLLLGHSAWQIGRPSNGSMWNSCSFQPVGPKKGYSFTDLGAEGCCRSLNALFSFPMFCWIKIHGTMHKGASQSQGRGFGPIFHSDLSCNQGICYVCKLRNCLWHFLTKINIRH